MNLKDYEVLNKACGELQNLNTKFYLSSKNADSSIIKPDENSTEVIIEQITIDDIIHTYTLDTLTKPYMRRFCDIFAIVTPSIVIYFNYNKIYAYKFFIELGIFHIYKQLICISTRLPPSVDPEKLSRTVLGFTIATPIDYGISGHTSIPVLIYFHTNSYFALINSILQTILSVITKDHYTIDVIHTWIFIYAIFNRLNFIY